MQRNFLFSLFISLLLFSLSEEKEICTENGKFPCLIVDGPEFSDSISVTENGIRSYYCQFSDASKENHISNYKWYLDNHELGVVNMKNMVNDHWYISYDEQLKRSKLDIIVSKLSLGKHSLSCKYANELNLDEPVEEKSVNFVATMEKEEKMDNAIESRGYASNRVAVNLDGIQIDFYFRITFNRTILSEEELKNIEKQLKPIFIPPYEYLYYFRNYDMRYVYIRLNGHVGAIKRMEPSEISQLVARLTQIVLNLKVTVNETNVAVAEETSLESSFKEYNRRIRERPCSSRPIYNLCADILSTCSSYSGKVYCQAICHNECRRKNEECYVKYDRPVCTCKKGYIPFAGGRCKSKGSAYGVIFGTMAALIIMMMAITSVLTVFIFKRITKDPQEKIEEQLQKKQRQLQKLKEQQAKIKQEEKEKEANIPRDTRLQTDEKTGNFNPAFQKPEEQGNNGENNNIYEKLKFNNFLVGQK